MAKRTPKQIAATKKLVAMNKARAGKKSPKKGAAKKASGSRASGGKGLAGRVTKLEKTVKTHTAQIGSIQSRVSNALEKGRKAMGLSSGKKAAKKGAKKTGAKKGGKRSPAQVAATKKMLAANKAKAGKKTAGKKAGGKKGSRAKSKGSSIPRAEDWVGSNPSGGDRMSPNRLRSML